MTEDEILKVLLKFAHSYLRNHPGIRDEVWDVVNESWLLIPDIQNKYDSSKGASFSTYLWRRLDWHFRLKFVREARLIPVDFSEIEIADEFPSFERFAFLNTLSDNARAFMEAVLDSSENVTKFIATFSRKSPVTILNLIGHYYLGFDRKEVKRIKKELLVKFIS